MLFNKLKKNTDLSEIFKKSTIALLIRVLGFISGYLFIYFVVKFFGAETQGRLSLAFSFMIIGALICRLGLDINFVKIFAIKDNFNNAKGIYFKTLPIVFFPTLVLALSIFIFSDSIAINFFNDQGFSQYLKWTAPCIILFSITLLNAGVFRGLKYNTLYAFLFNGGRFFFSLIIFLLLYYFGFINPINAIVAHTISICLLFFISGIYILKYLSPIRLKSSYEPKSFIKDSLPMLFSATMTVFLGWSDTIILGIYKTPEVIGFYSVALKIAVVVSFTLQAINSILAPKLSNAFHNNNLKLFKNLVKYATRVNFVISLVSIVIIIAFRDYILEIFGPEFLQVSTALIILCIGQLFNAICGPVGVILQMTGQQKVFQNILFLALIINIVLNLSLINTYGINGVAFSTAFSLAFWNITAYIYTRKIIIKS